MSRRPPPREQNVDGRRRNRRRRPLRKVGAGETPRSKSTSRTANNQKFDVKHVALKGFAHGQSPERGHFCRACGVQRVTGVADAFMTWPHVQPTSDG